MPVFDPAATKATLRLEVLARRDALDPVARARLSSIALSRVSALSEYRQARAVLGYASFGSEARHAPPPPRSAG